MSSKAKKQSSVREIISLGLILALYALASCTVLAVVNAFTAPTIKQNQIEKTNLAMKAVFQDADSFEELDSFVSSSEKSISVNKVVVAYQNGKVIGAIAEVEGPTYDRASILIGVNTQGKVKGLQFLSNTDSPGFGQKAGDKNFHLANGNTFYGQFTGLTVADGFVLNKTLDSISGATITSQGVANLAKEGASSAMKALENFMEESDEKSSDISSMGDEE